jgi:hypothetical protein
MTSSCKNPINEQGSILVVVLLILALITIMGISGTTTTEIELQIARNDRFYKTAFYNADSGVHVTPKLISACVNDGEPVTNPSGITYLDANGEPDPSDDTLDDIFFNEIMGFEEILGRDPHDEADDILFTLGGHNIQIDIERTGQESLAGGGVEFGSGAEGVGVGSTGGVALLYTMDSVGAGPNASQSNIEAVYRLVPGVAGGL